MRVTQQLFWDNITMRVNGAQVRMARAALKWNVRELAAAAQVSPNTVTRIEADLPANAATLSVIQRVLEAAGIEFINGDSPGARMLPSAKPRSKKASAKKAKPVANSRRRDGPHGARTVRRIGPVEAPPLAVG
jgi:transcriptional regulator with XRE-family HTH domain